MRHAWLQGCISWQKCHWSNYRDDEFSLSNQITSVGNIFVLSHLKLITLPMHSPTNTRHNITGKEKYRNASLGRHANRCRQNSWKKTGWSHGTVSMAVHCLGYNKLTTDGNLANHVFDAAAAAAVFDTGSEAILFPDSPHRTTVHPLWPFLLKLYNDKCSRQAIWIPDNSTCDRTLKR